MILKIISREEIQSFLLEQNLDIRLTNNGRWIDQKCTPDVLCVIADFILTYLSREVKDLSYKFTNKEIWYSDRAKEVVRKLFKKPDVTKKTAQNEYDKLFGQPMKLLSAAGILKEYPKQGYKGAHLYKVENLDILEYISYREINALEFLIVYIEETLIASDIYNIFEKFFMDQDNNSYIDLKIKFADFMRKYTNIKGEYEPNRIFTKVINPLAFDKNLRGTERGRLSNNTITYDMLMYNRDNFRDIYMEKPKNMTREEYMKQENIHMNTDLTEYQISKAKRIVRAYNDEFRDGMTEHYEVTENKNLATQIHHIFPKNEFWEIAAYIENLIALTPNQHFLKAHKNNQTQYVDKDYQHLLLLSKMKTIVENISSNNVIYSMDNFKYVLSVGFDDESFIKMDNDYSSIKSAIDQKYI